jgi:protein-L-isoaspartate(D-aspartate) O-methyltransferase
MNPESEYEKLVDRLVSSGHIRSADIERAFRKYDRTEFLPEEHRVSSGEDRPLPIGSDQSGSQPFTVAFMLDLLDPQKGDIVLDAGSGSGWQAALLADCVGPEGKVITVERVSDLAAKTKDNLEKFGLISSGAIMAVHGSAVVIDPEWPVFNKIISAAEGEEVPVSWKNSLAVGGRIVMPVKGRLIVADKTSVSEFDIKEYPGFSFNPLIV